MAVLINAYATVPQLPEITFDHQLNGERSLPDPELVEHLNGFAGYVLSRGDGALTPTKEGVLLHIQRVRHHVAMTVDESRLEDFADWAWSAKAICFMTDGAVTDPSLWVLVDGDGSGPDVEAKLP